MTVEVRCGSGVWTLMAVLSSAKDKNMPHFLRNVAFLSNIRLRSRQQAPIQSWPPASPVGCSTLHKPLSSAEDKT